MKVIDGKESAAVTPFDFTVAYDGSRCRVIEIDFQRNGVYGMGFFVLRFQCSAWPERPLVGVVFDYDEEDDAVPLNPRTAVMDPCDLTAHWRGDVFDAGLRDAITARYEEIWAS